MQFIIYLYKFSSNESEKASDMAKAIGVEIQKFLDLLINNVDLKADNAVDILKVLRNTSLPPKYRKIVMSVVSFYKICMYVMVLYIFHEYNDIVLRQIKEV